jgi:hypothetical protein
LLNVLGNHAHRGDTERSLYWLDKTGKNLRHRLKRVERNGQALWSGSTAFPKSRFCDIDTQYFGAVMTYRRG